MNKKKKITKNSEKKKNAKKKKGQISRIQQKEKYKDDKCKEKQNTKK